MERACIRVAIFDTVVRIAVEIDINAYGFIRFPVVESHVGRMLCESAAGICYHIGHLCAYYRHIVFIGFHCAVLVEHDTALGHVAELKFQGVILAHIVGRVGCSESPPGIVIPHRVVHE